MDVAEIKIKELSKIAHETGLKVLGWTSDLELPADSERLNYWQEAGFNAEMDYMARPAEVFSNLQHILPSAQSLVSFAVHYSYQPREELQPEHGLVARYAWGMDYHIALKRRLDLFKDKVQRLLGVEVEAKSFTDSVPILERAFAKKSGLGFIGKNSMLIQKGVGSYFLIGEIVWNLKISNQNPLPILSDNNDFQSDCGSCSRCIDLCPTSAISKPMVIDSNKCISYLSIEKKRMFSNWERKALGKWVFGCDECQDCCPFNHRSLAKEDKPVLEEFEELNGVGQQLNLREVLQIKSNREYEKKFANTPLLRPRRSGLIRNSICVAVNTKAESLLEPIRLLAQEDPSEVIRAHALWGVSELEGLAQDGRSKGLHALIKSALNDNSEYVRSEAQALAGL